MNKLILPSPAKINLFLHINGKRNDGYHQLQTLFQFLDYGDTLSFECPATNAPSNNIQLSCNLPQLQNDDNLIIRAAKLLQKHYAPQQGVNIHLDKILPMGGGVGGGSSNAATTLLALNRLWQLKLSEKQLIELGLTLGADVPVFIHGHAVFAQGVGEIFTPANPPMLWYLIAQPNCHISTAEIFQHPELIRNAPVLDLKKYNFANTTNNCEPLVKKLYPEVANTIERLIEYAPTRLTGTGGCIFSTFKDEKSAQQAKTHLPEGVLGFIAQGQNVSSTITALNDIQANPLSEMIN